MNNSESERAIRVAIADDHPVVLAGIKALLQAAPEIELVGEATSGTTALRSSQNSCPTLPCWT